MAGREGAIVGCANSQAGQWAAAHRHAGRQVAHRDVRQRHVARVGYREGVSNGFPYFGYAVPVVVPGAGFLQADAGVLLQRRFRRVIRLAVHVGVIVSKVVRVIGGVCDGIAQGIFSIGCRLVGITAGIQIGLGNGMGCRASRAFAYQQRGGQASDRAIGARVGNNQVADDSITGIRYRNGIVDYIACIEDAIQAKVDIIICFS